MSFEEGPEMATLLGYQMQMAILALGDSARIALAPFGITPARLAALLLVRDNPGCDQTTLGRALSVNRSSAMKIVNLLADQGLVERRPGRDLRSHALHLTEHGTARVRAMVDTLRARDRRIAAALDPGEFDTLLALLAKLRRGAPRWLEEAAE